MAFDSLKLHLKDIYFQRLGLVGASGLALMVSGIILLPILTKTLPVEDYGRWVQFLIILRAAFIVSEMGISIAMLRFMPSEKDTQKVSEQFYTTLIIILTLNGLASVALLTYPQMIANYLFGGAIQLVYSASIILPITGLNIVCLYYFRARNQIKKQTLFTNMQAYLVVGIVGALVLIQKNLMIAVAGYTIAQIILFGVMFVVIAKEIGIRAPNPSYLKSYFKFGLPVASNNIMHTIIGSSDRVLIGIFMTMTYVGYYNTAYSIGFVLMFLAAPFTTVLPQTLINLYDSGKVLETKREIVRAVKMFLYLAVPAGVFVSIFRELIIKTITTQEIAQNSSYLIPIFVIGALIYGCQSIISNYLFITKETGMLLLISIITVVAAVISNLILIPLMGIIGAAIALVIANTLKIIITSYRIWGLKS